MGPIVFSQLILPLNDFLVCFRLQGDALVVGDPHDVNQLLKKMTHDGINPDIVTFNTLIEVHTKAGRLRDAY